MYLVEEKVEYFISFSHSFTMIGFLVTFGSYQQLGVPESRAYQVLGMCHSEKTAEGNFVFSNTEQTLLLYSCLGSIVYPQGFSPPEDFLRRCESLSLLTITKVDLSRL